MKIIVLISSEFDTAAHHLPFLIDSKTCEITMVVCSQNTKTGRRKYYQRKISKIWKIGVLGTLNGIRMRKWYKLSGQDEQLKSIAQICKEHRIDFHRTPRINCAETHELFAQANADLGVSLGNGFIAPGVFNIPKYGMINIHHEILPAFQNAQSVIWQLYFESATTGYTIHQIDKHIDTGAILHQESVPINCADSLGETVSRTYLNLLNSSAKGLIHCTANFDTQPKNAQNRENEDHLPPRPLNSFLKFTGIIASLEVESNCR